MSTNDKIFLIIPGIGGSGSKHWQSLWEKKYANFIRVEQQSWDRPVCTQWLENIEKSVSGLKGEIYFVAHSLGCIAVAHWAQQTQLSNVSGALLVAPPDLSIVQSKSSIQGFEPIPLRSLPFKSTLVASTNDEYADISKSWQYAHFWQSHFVNIGNKGHINAESGFGEWNEGYALLQELVVTASLLCFSKQVNS